MSNQYHITSSPYPSIHMAAEACRTDKLPSSTEERLRGQMNPHDRSEISVSESSSQSLAVKALDVDGRQRSPSGSDTDVRVLCLQPMDGPKKLLLELGCKHQYMEYGCTTCSRTGNTDLVHCMKQRSLQSFKRVLHEKIPRGRP